MRGRGSLTFILIIVLLSLFKLWLVTALPLTAYGTASYDDRLFLNLADAFIHWLSSFARTGDWSTLFHGGWLGDYNRLTLVKGPMYPLWVAFCFVDGAPLLFGQQVLYILAGITLVLALRKFITRPWLLLLLFIFYLFCPATMTRVTREGIYPALAVFVLSGYIGIHANHREKLSKMFPWSLLSGLALSAFWLTREEGVWIMPLVVLLLAYTLLSTYRTFRFSSESLKRALPCVLPLLVLLVVLNAVALMNWLHYGVYTTVEMKSKSFLSAVGALQRVKHPHWRSYIPVPREVRRSIYKVSPAFKELQPFLEGDACEKWEIISCAALPKTCGDIAGGWFVWALRDAVSFAKYYTGGAKAEAYYKRLAEEINTACEDGRLDCLAERNTIMPPLRRAYIRPVIKRFFKIAEHLFEFTHDPTGEDPSTGPEESLAIFRDLTREKPAPSATDSQEPSEYVSIRGWAFSQPPSPIHFSVTSGEGNEDNFYVKHFPSDDVDKQFNWEYVGNKSSNFEIRTPYSEGSLLRFFDETGLAAVMIIDNPQKSVRILTDKSNFYLYSATHGKPEQLQKVKHFDDVKIKLLQTFENYKTLVMPVSLLAVALYLVSFIGCIFKRRVSFLFIVNTAVLMAIASRLLILAIIDVISFPALRPSYLAPSYPFLAIFTVLAVVDFVQGETMTRMIAKMKYKTG